MAINNKERITRGLDTFATGFWPLINDAMTKRSPMGGNWVEQYPGAKLQHDVSAQITVIKDHRPQIFRYVLSKDEFNWVFEVSDWRNKVAHGEPISTDDAYRALDTMERVLNRHAPAVATELLNAKQGLLREKANEAAVKAKPKMEDLFSGEVTGLKPWREVIQPHPDVAAGRFSAAEFAADLFMVHHGLGSREYTEPVPFFERTYITEGLGNLLRLAARRIDGDEGAPPVIDLQTTFGGGKTHSMISLYHLFSGVPTHDLPQDMQDFLQSEGITQLPKAQRAVIVGTRFSPVLPQVKDDGTEVGTIWGEIAWQLGGRKAFDEIAASDSTPGNPGDHLRKVIEDAAPCVILIDEWVAYAAQLLGDATYRGGNFDTQFYFAQALTEIVKSVPGALLVVSLPASVDTNGQEIISQVSGQDAHLALTKLRDAVGRTKNGWSTAKGDEQFEIVRRRLFQTPDPENLKFVRATAKTYSDFYSKQAAEFPPEAKEAEYTRRIERSYPIHPELFTRLYDDWSTLERFQQTRGVLRLMAQVIHALWSGNDRAPMIMPGNVPVDDAAVATELVSNLSEVWPPIIHRDVDGEDSTPRAIDLQYPNLNQYAATRRVARTVLLGSAPSLNSANRGIEIQRVRLGSILPGEQVSVFNDALAKLVARATYLYNEGTRYWYGTQAHVGQLARDRAEQIKSNRLDLIEDEIRRRLTDQSRARGSFQAVHVMPGSPGDVADTDAARLIILSPEQAHQGKGESPATTAAKALLEQRGNAARIYRNMVVFLAADQRQVEALTTAAAEFLAWQQLDGEKVHPLNLDPLNQKQVEDRLRDATARLDGAVREAYKQALVPVQSTPAAAIEFEAVRCDGADGIAERCSKKLVTSGMLSTAYSSEMLRNYLDGVLAPVWELGHCTVKELWDVMARYTYLPRLVSADSLIEVLSEGAARMFWSTETWALAAGIDDSGKYIGLSEGARPMGVNVTWLVVQPAVALAQQKKDAEDEEAVDDPEKEDDDDDTPDKPQQTKPSQKPAPKRFWGTKSLNASSARLVREFEQVQNEVVAHLQRELGSEVTISVHIEVTNPNGFSEKTVRDVIANADTLKFDDRDFA